MWTTFASGIVPTSYTVIGLTQGLFYSFKVLARNKFGESVYSASVTILAAQIPDAPLEPTTTFTEPNVIIDWIAPNIRGSAILGYRVYIQNSDLSTYSTEFVDCDGADATIMGDTLCTVPKLTLRGSPFNLPWGSSIYVKVIAYNVYGDSAESPVGNGAVILTNPDAPTDLIEVYADRTATALGISWTEGPADGGRPVLDYQVSYDQAIDDYVVLETGILLENFVAEGL